MVLISSCQEMLGEGAARSRPSADPGVPRQGLSQRHQTRDGLLGDLSAHGHLNEGNIELRRGFELGSHCRQL